MFYAPCIHIIFFHSVEEKLCQQYLIFNSMSYSIFHFRAQVPHNRGHVKKKNNAFNFWNMVHNCQLAVAVH